MIAAILIILFSASLSYFWIRGIDFMKENHPDYRGEDLFYEKDNINVL